MPIQTFSRRLDLSVPADFVLHRAVMGHGWFDLPPFLWEMDPGRLTLPLRLPDAGPVVARVGRPSGRRDVLRLELQSRRLLTRADLASARKQVAHVLRLDENLSAFHVQADRIGLPDLTWVRTTGAGRLMRSPGVFEDLVKMIATTNCTWALTRVMVRALVQHLGDEAPGGVRLFPTPAAMAAVRSAFYRDVARAGYRGEALRGLARDVAAGRLDPESWLDPARPTPDIRKEILSVRGAGPYVADNMLKLLGRYDGLGIDSWCRRKFSQMHAAGRKVTDRRIERFYAPFGTWRGLALWCDITRDWFEEGSPREKFAQADY
ncbi:MAG: DNA-3-methyladenine glycosylase family protein [Candidatus Polarisedimenticolia bacterium]